MAKTNFAPDILYSPTYHTSNKATIKHFGSDILN